jgi:hypothetical protein
MKKKDLKTLTSEFSEKVGQTRAQRKPRSVTLPARKKLEVDNTKPPQLKNRMKKIYYDRIVVSPVNERDQGLLTPETCADLIESIAEEGQQQPVQVIERPGADESPDSTVYELVSGSRRLFSISHLAKSDPARGWVDCIIMPGNIPSLKDDPAGWLAFAKISEAENKYERVSRYERSLFIRKLWDSGIFKTQAEMAEHFQNSEAWASQMLGFSEFPREAAKQFSKDLQSLRPSHAAALRKAIADPEKLTNKVRETVERLRSEDPDLGGPRLIEAVCKEITAKRLKGRQASKPDAVFDFGEAKVTTTKKDGRQLVSLSVHFSKDRDTLSEDEAQQCADLLVKQLISKKK